MRFPLDYCAVPVGWDAWKIWKRIQDFIPIWLMIHLEIDVASTGLDARHLRSDYKTMAKWAACRSRPPIGRRRRRKHQGSSASAGEPHSKHR